MFKFSCWKYMKTYENLFSCPALLRAETTEWCCESVASSVNCTSCIECLLNMTELYVLNTFCIVNGQPVNHHFMLKTFANCGFKKDLATRSFLWFIRMFCHLTVSFYETPKNRDSMETTKYFFFAMNIWGNTSNLFPVSSIVICFSVGSHYQHLLPPATSELNSAKWQIRSEELLEPFFKEMTTYQSLSAKDSLNKPLKQISTTQQAELIRPHATSRVSLGGKPGMHGFSEGISRTHCVCIAGWGTWFLFEVKRNE